MSARFVLIIFSPPSIVLRSYWNLIKNDDIGPKWALFQSPNSSCGNQYLTEHEGDSATFDFESDIIEVYATTKVEGVVIEIRLDNRVVRNITLNSSQLSVSCNPVIFSETVPRGPHRIEVTLLERRRSAAGVDTGALVIDGFGLNNARYSRTRFYSKQDSRGSRSYLYSSVVGGIALIGAIALQYFSPDRRRRQFKRRTYNTSYDVSDMPPFSKKMSQHSPPATNSGFAMLQSTTGNAAHESHPVPHPSSSATI
ncbi:hypothetical protein FRC03_011127 [Tulasnella sp. 419]|nr:hypothetical protein FRC03_011127 [Tulasnella sp. 419]